MLIAVRAGLNILTYIHKYISNTPKTVYFWSYDIISTCYFNRFASVYEIYRDTILFVRWSRTSYPATQYRSYNGITRLRDMPRVCFSVITASNKQTCGITRLWSLYEQYCVVKYLVRGSEAVNRARYLNAP